MKEVWALAEQALKQAIAVPAKPILKWAGGKTQMLGDLLPKVPSSYGRYIEPFFGGGAMFFALQPEQAVIADSNPELINLYRQVANHVDDVICQLKKYENTQEMFYAVRGQDWTMLPEAEAAARTIFLNKTCFNGLYRVNKKGRFNVHFGKYKNPKICDEEGLKAASAALKKAEIVCGDYSSCPGALCANQETSCFLIHLICLFLNIRISKDTLKNNFMKRIMLS